MACCKCCCGNVDCAEGQEGKCCCGGTAGECCQQGEYCCDGACEPDPCLGACCDDTFGCTQTANEADCTAVGGTWKGFGVPCDPNPCGCEDDLDCPYWVVLVSDYSEPGCEATHAVAYFDNEADAEDYALGLSGCFSIIYQPDYGICCDGACYPAYDSLPLYTNTQPGELTCP